MMKLLSVTTFQVDEHNALMPDVVLLSRARETIGAKGLFQGAPELAAEAVSSETAARLEERSNSISHTGASRYGLCSSICGLCGCSMLTAKAGSSTPVRCSKIQPYPVSARRSQPSSKASDGTTRRPTVTSVQLCSPSLDRNCQ
jgi:hypothetical protein